LPGTLLEAGRALVLDAQGTPRDSAETVLQATAWLQREIVFQQSPLQVVVDDFNQYSTVPIVIESAELESMTISGIFGAYDLESFLQFLSSLDGVAVEVKQDRIRVYVVKHFSEQALTVEAGREKSSIATRDRKSGENP
jgi:ferric-dicitrate binding protein FerR (iron transport regulator)